MACPSIIRSSGLPVSFMAPAPCSARRKIVSCHTRVYSQAVSRGPSGRNPCDAAEPASAHLQRIPPFLITSRIDVCYIVRNDIQSRWRAFIDTMALIIELFITYLPWAHIFIQQLYCLPTYKHSLDAADLIDRLLQRSVVILNDFWFVSYARATVNSTIDCVGSTLDPR